MAPTGIAALNIGGKTIHSVCKLPPYYINKSDIKRLPNVQRQFLCNLNLIIIDEISMVSSNLLDALDDFLRMNRGIFKPFGGVHILLVGDLFQLPPIVDNKYDLFIEYVDAIRGKAQLFWSRGLKSKVGIDDKTDEELAKEKEDNADIITMISKPEWFIIRKKEKRAEVLDVAENEPKNIRSFIFGIVEDNIKMNDPPTEGR